MKIDTCYKAAVFLIAGILFAGCGSSSSDDLADKLRENVELAKEQDISDEKDSEDISEETAAEDGSSKQDEDNDAGTAEELTEDTSEETENEDVEDASETEEESEPYGDILRWYKTLQDSGKTWEEMEQYASQTELIQHGWPFGTDNTEIRYVYQDITGDGYDELIITYYNDPVDIYTNDGDAIHAYSVPYRAIAEIYPDGIIMEGLSIGTKGWSRTWYRYNDRTCMFEPSGEELQPEGEAMTFADGKKIADVDLPDD